MLQVISQAPSPAGMTGKEDSAPVAAAATAVQPAGVVEAAAEGGARNAGDATVPTEFLLPEDVAQALLELGEMLEAADTHAEEGGQQQAADLYVGAVESATALLETLPDPVAEQWLLSMLGQQSTQVSARDVDEQIVETDARTAMAATDQAIQLVARTNARQMQTVAAPAAVVADRVYIAEQAESLSTSRAAVQAPSIAAPASGESATALAASIAPIAVAPTEAPAGSNATPLHAIEQAAAPDPVLRLRGSEARWGEQLLHALRDSVDVQLQQRVQNATIRLDPPELGSMEIFLSHESGRLGVHISASQVDVARLLQHTSERLRQELVAQNFVEVSVEISSGGQPGQQNARQGGGFAGEEVAIADNREPGLQAADRSRQRADVLVTV